VESTKTAERADATHDVLMQFAGGHPPWFALVAVVVDGAPIDDLQRWMAEAALKIDANIGVLASEPHVVPKSRTPLSLLEDSYAADLSRITWRGEEPTGAP